MSNDDLKESVIERLEQLNKLFDPNQDFEMNLRLNRNNPDFLKKLCAVYRENEWNSHYSDELLFEMMESNLNFIYGSLKWGN